MQQYYDKRIAEISATSKKERLAFRIAEIETELSNVADAIAQVGMNQTLAEKLEQLTQERNHLRIDQRAATIDPRLAKDIAQALPMLMRQNIALVEHLGTNKRTVDPRAVARAHLAMEKLTGKIALTPQQGPAQTAPGGHPRTYWGAPRAAGAGGRTKKPQAKTRGYVLPDR